MRALPDMYAQLSKAAGPREEGIHNYAALGQLAYISGKAQMPVLQLI